MNFAPSELELPLRVRFERSMSDDELLRFCAANDPLQIERDSNGELIIMSPNFDKSGSVEAEVLIELGIWARSNGNGKVFGSSSGFTLPDKSMRAPDVAWVSLRRWQALTENQIRSFTSICPDSSSKFDQKPTG